MACETRVEVDLEVEEMYFVGTLVLDKEIHMKASKSLSYCH